MCIRDSNSITHIVTLSVCYISDEIQILAFLSAEQTVNGLDNHLDDIDKMCIRDRIY